MMVLAVGVSAIGVRVLSGLSWSVILLSMLPIALIDNVLFGQPVPLVLGSLVLAGCALRSGHDRIAAVFACAMLIEPHIGIASCASLILWRPKTRLVFFVAFVMVLIVSLSTHLGSSYVEYVVRVLPQQAQSEVSWVVLQYSLTHALWVLGASSQLSLVAGSVWFVLLFVASVMVAPRLARQFDSPALLVLFPAAVSVFGGAYVHLVQTTIALPASAVLVGKGSGTTRTIAAVAFVGLLFSGAELVVSLWALGTAVIGVLVAWQLAEKSRIVSAVFALGVGVVWWMLRDLPSAIASHRVGQVAAIVDFSVLAQASWQEFVLLENPGARLQLLVLLSEVPLLAALGVIFVLGLYYGWPRGETAKHFSSAESSEGECP